MSGYQALNQECDIRQEDGTYGCGSSDAMVINKDGSHYCFSCGCISNGGDEARGDLRQDMEVSSHPRYEAFRGIAVAITRKYGCKVGTYIDPYSKKAYAGSIYYPIHGSDDEVVGHKIRKGGNKDFTIEGKSKGQLFGQHLFGDKGILTITEGQDDAMAAHQMTGGKWPVVSVSSASAAVSDIKRNIEFVQQFKEVVICFDADDAGKKAATQVADFLGGNNVKVMQMLTHKDANDYLANGDTEKFKTEFWNAKQYSPEGVVLFEDAWEHYLKRNATKRYPLPHMFGGLNRMLNGGIGAGEITTIGALTSIGKTTVVNNLVYGLLQENEGIKVGYFGAETDVGELIEGLMSIHTGNNLSDSELRVSNDAVKEEFNAVEWKKRLAILDHDGSMRTETLVNKIKAMIKMLDLNVFILDPLQATLPNLDNATVEEFMDDMLKIAKQTDVSLVLVSHMKKPEGKSPHAVSEYDLKGSSAINQVSFNTILLSRDKTAEEADKRHATKVQLVKARKGRDTGDAGWIKYDGTTARLEATDNPYMEA